MSATDDAEGENAREREVIRLVELDHQSTTEFVARLTGIRTAARTIILTLGSTLVGLALTVDKWISVPALLVATAGLLIEARYELLLRVTHSRLRTLEYSVQAYITSLVERGTVEKIARTRFERELVTYQFGMSRALRGGSVVKALRMSKRNPIAWIYVVLVILMPVVFVTEMGTADNSSGADDVCVVSDSRGLMKIEELPAIATGTVTVVNCG